MEQIDILKYMLPGKLENPRKLTSVLIQKKWTNLNRIVTAQFRKGKFNNTIAKAEQYFALHIEPELRDQTEANTHKTQEVTKKTDDDLESTIYVYLQKTNSS